VHALRDAGPPAEADVMVAVMGPDGSGNSTLLTAAESLEGHQRGHPAVGGRDRSGRPVLRAHDR
jgi:ABC-type lipoprotein export system ATPase subunit